MTQSVILFYQSQDYNRLSYTVSSALCSGGEQR